MIAGTDFTVCVKVTLPFMATQTSRERFRYSGCIWPTIYEDANTDDGKKGNTRH